LQEFIGLSSVENRYIVLLCMEAFYLYTVGLTIGLSLLCTFHNVTIELAYYNRNSRLFDTVPELKHRFIWYALC